MTLMETLGIEVACLISDEGLEHEFGEQMNLMDTGPQVTKAITI